MSMLKAYDKKMTPCRVKSEEREDVDINKLVAHGAAGLVPPNPVYADLTELPKTRGEATHALQEAIRGLPQDLVRSLLSLKPEEANQFINLLRPASKRDDEQRDKTDVPVQGDTNITLGQQQRSGPGGPQAAGGAAEVRGQ